MLHNRIVASCHRIMCADSFAACMGDFMRKLHQFIWAWSRLRLINWIFCNNGSSSTIVAETALYGQGYITRHHQSRNVISLFKLTVTIGASTEIVLMWLPQNTFYGKSFCSVSDLVRSDNKSLPDPTLTQLFATVRRHQNTVSLYTTDLTLMAVPEIKALNMLNAVSI